MNKNQKIMLAWLKENVEKSKYGVIHELDNATDDVDDEVNNAYNLLSWTEELEVIKAFAEWGLRDGCK